MGSGEDNGKEEWRRLVLNASWNDDLCIELIDDVGLTTIDATRPNATIERT